MTEEREEPEDRDEYLEAYKENEWDDIEEHLTEEDNSEVEIKEEGE